MLPPAPATAVADERGAGLRRAVGAETRLPDVAITSFEVPAFAIAGKPLRVPFTIESSLPRDEAVTVR
jgi:hypothetical protein